MIRKSFPAITKAVDDDQGIVEAIVNCTAVTDLQKDFMEPGCWTFVIKAAQDGEADWPSLVWGHDWSVTTGKVLLAEELPPGDARLKTLKGAVTGALRIVAQYNLGTQRGREAFSDVKFGAVKQWSVGFLSAPDGEHFDHKGIRHVTKVGVWPEVSNVLIGASPGTYTAIAKSAEQSDDRPQRSADRIAQGQGIFEHVVVTKDMGIPLLTGDEAMHNKPLNDALTALKTLIQQELAEKEPEFDCVNRLSAIALQLQSWAQDEANEYTDYTAMAVPMAEVIQAGIKAISTKEVAVAEEPKATADEPETPASETSPEAEAVEPPVVTPDLDLNDPSTWTPAFFLAVQELYRELLSPPQHSDPDTSGEDVLTSFARQNTRQGQLRRDE